MVIMCGLATMTLAHIYSIYYKKVDVYRTDVKESMFEAINQKDSNGVLLGYRNTVKGYIKMSDYDAWMWTASEMFTMVAITAVMFSLVKSKASAGAIMSAVTYCWKLFGSVTCLSYFLNQVKGMETAKEKLKEVEL